jgi:hypothetical protein
MKPRSLGLIATLSVLCPALSQAAEVVAMLEPSSPVLAAPSHNYPNKHPSRATPVPSIKLACIEYGKPCKLSDECCGASICQSGKCN